MKFPFAKSRLRKTIERGLVDGDLCGKLKELGDLPLQSAAQAEDICWGLQQLKGGSEHLSQQVYALAGLFQDVEGRENAAFEVLQARGIPELLRLFDDLNQAPADENADTSLFVLKVLALYGTVGGTLKVVETARRALQPDGFMWSVILRNFTAAHPEKELLYTSLRDPLPAGFIAVSLLDAANQVLLEGDPMPHPFDTAEGRQRLRDWLSSPDPDAHGYAHSATAALPFLGHPERDLLLELALKHRDTGVQLEAAWAAAKIGRDDGLQRLVEHCRDFRTAQTARHYLSELGHEPLVPPEANEPGFVALAEFAQWLAHPNELGRAPDALEIVDHRELPWPPEREMKPLWLIQYTLRDATGLEDDAVERGLVGSVTFCLFSYQLAQRPAEDAYAVHCCWEVENKGLIEETDVQDDADEYASLLQEWKGPQLENPQVMFVAELAPELGYPQRLVGLASAQVHGEDGWVVLDGARSGWYPRSEQPQETCESVVLKVHVGRHLLGFGRNPDRKKCLASTKPPKPPEQIIAAYENLLKDAEKTKGTKQERAFSLSGPIDKHFECYVEALTRSGRASEIPGWIRRMAPYWEHPHGYAKLGNAAFKCGQLDVAEEFFLKYRDQSANHERGEEMGSLAEIWCRTGRQDAAKELLLRCLHSTLEESNTATGSDKALFEKWFQHHRSVFLRLFPNGELLLTASAIPSSILPDARA